MWKSIPPENKSQAKMLGFPWWTFERQYGKIIGPAVPNAMGKVINESARYSYIESDIIKFIFFYNLFNED